MPPPDAGTVPLRDGLHLHYRRLGQGDPLVVPAASWLDGDLGPLAQSRSLVLYDLVGRGRSSPLGPADDLGLERDLADLGELQTRLDLGPVALLGWSYHGLLAARYALERPGRVERLVLVGPSGPRRDPHLGRFLDAFATRIDLDDLEALEELRKSGAPRKDPVAWCRAVHRLYFRAYVAEAASLARLQSSPCVAPNLDPERVNELGRRSLEALGDFDWREDFGRLEVPTLILHGTEDPVPIEGAREWAAALPAARLLTIEGVGHMPWIERPEAFFPAVSRFLAGDVPA